VRASGNGGSENGRARVPIVRQLRIQCRLGCRDGGLLPDREMDPTMTMRTSPRETGILPPGTHQWVVDVPATVFQPEVDRLHRLPTAGVGTGRLRIDNMRRHQTVEPPLPIRGVHLIELVGRRSRRFSDRVAHRSPPDQSFDDRSQPPPHSTGIIRCGGWERTARHRQRAIPRSIRHHS
jgi:hypothetical protein